MSLLIRASFGLPFLILGMFFLPIHFLSAQDKGAVAGEWNGTIEIPGQSLEVVVKLEMGERWSGTFDIPLQGVKGFPLKDIVVSVPEVLFSMGGGVPGSPAFSLKLQEGGTVLSGTFSQSGATFPATFTKVGGSDQVVEAVDLREQIAAYLEKAGKARDIPGLAVAVVRDGEVFYSEGFGVREVGTDKPVTTSTLFAIGSTTKAFTSVLIGILVDEGKLDWDEPVRSYLHDFQLKDEYATAHLTVRDLLDHLSGLPRHDFLWYGTNLTREQLYSRLGDLDPAAELRQKWQYQNLMYMTAGILAERVTGTSWEQLLREKILDPLGMTHTVLSVEEMQRSSDYSEAHAEKHGGVVKIDMRSLDAIGPAGAINASVDEMARWLMLNLNGGEFEGKRIISEESLKEIHSPQAIVSPETGVREMLFSLYGMGWMISAYRGHRLLHHGGGIDGFITHVGLLPDDGIGIVVLSNNPSGLPQQAVLDIADMMLGLDPLNHAAGELASTQMIRKQQEEAEQLLDLTRVKGTSPTYPLSEYEGMYENPGYGRIELVLEGDSLRGDLNGRPFVLKHYHYDVFRFTEDRTGTQLFTFQPDPAGGVSGLKVLMEASLPALLFEKLPSERMTDPAYLERFAGAYTMSVQTVNVDVRDSALVLTIPGQPTYHLHPKREVSGQFAEFSLEDLEGFKLRFEEAGGGVHRAVFIQPNGVFIAEKK